MCASPWCGSAPIPASVRRGAVKCSADGYRASNPARTHKNARLEPGAEVNRTGCAGSAHADPADPFIQTAFQARRAIAVMVAAPHRLVDQGRRAPVGLAGPLGVVRVHLFQNVLDGAADRRTLGRVVQAPRFVLPGSFTCLWRVRQFRCRCLKKGANIRFSSPDVKTGNPTTPPYCRDGSAPARPRSPGWPRSGCWTGR